MTECIHYSSYLIVHSFDTVECPALSDCYLIVSCYKRCWWDIYSYTEKKKQQKNAVFIFRKSHCVKCSMRNVEFLSCWTQTGSWPGLFWTETGTGGALLHYNFCLVLFCLYFLIQLWILCISLLSLCFVKSLVTLFLNVF